MIEINRKKFLPLLTFLALFGCIDMCLAQSTRDVVPIKPTCNGNYQGKQISPGELAAILEKHVKWLAKDNYKNEEGRAVLCGAILNAVVLVGKSLKRADLSGAELNNAKLDDVDLTDADLSYANLNQASLKKTELVRTRLKNTEFYFADLKGAIYDSLPDNAPAIYSLSTAKNLHTILWRTSPHALFELRDLLRKAGLRGQEKEITYAIMKGENQRNPYFLDKWFNTILFDWTSDYGMSAGRPLWIASGARSHAEAIVPLALFRAMRCSSDMAL